MKGDIQKQQQLLLRLIRYGAFVRGSITDTCATCNRARCICMVESGSRAYRLTYKDSMQKTKTVYIPVRKLTKVKQMIKNYSEVRETLEKLIEVNINIFKQGN